MPRITISPVVERERRGQGKRDREREGEGGKERQRERERGKEKGEKGME